MNPNQDKIEQAINWLNRNKTYFWSVYRVRYGTKEKIESFKPIKGDTTDSEIGAESIAQLHFLLTSLADINGLRIEAKPALKAPDATIVVWDIVVNTSSQNPPIVAPTVQPIAQQPQTLNGISGLSGIEYLGKIEELSRERVANEQRVFEDRLKLIEERSEQRLKIALAEAELKRKEDELKRREAELKEWEKETQENVSKYSPIIESALGKIVGRFMGNTTTDSGLAGTGTVTATAPQTDKADPLQGLTEVQRANHAKVNHIAMEIISRTQNGMEVAAIEKIVKQVLENFEKNRNVLDSTEENRSAV